MRLLALLLAALGQRALCSQVSSHTQVHTQAQVSLRTRSIPTGDGKKYLVASIPGEAKIVYVALPNPAIRDLIVSGLNEPTSIFYDPNTSRLFIADVPDKVIYYFQLIALGNGKLISDGQKHMVAERVEATNICMDNGGNLYFTGQSEVDPPYDGMAPMAIFKISYVKIEQEKLAVKPVEGMYNGPAVTAPAGIVSDGANIYFTNSNGGKQAGTVLKAAAGGGGGPSPLADNEDDAFGLVLTERYIFYGTPDGIFAIPKSKSTAACGKDCKLITNKITKGNSMVWDGDGTIYIADQATNNIFAIPSGDNNPHKVTELANTGDALFGLALVQLTGDRGGARSSCPAEAICAVLAFSFLQHLRK